MMSKPEKLQQQPDHPEQDLERLLAEGDQLIRLVDEGRERTEALLKRTEATSDALGEALEKGWVKPDQYKILLHLAEIMHRDREWISDHFIFHESGALETRGDLDLHSKKSLIALPSPLLIGGNLNLSGCTDLLELPKGLEVKGDLILTACRQLQFLPEDLKVEGDLWLPEKNDLNPTENTSPLILRAMQLKKMGYIKGKLVTAVLKYREILIERLERSMERIRFSFRKLSNTLRDIGLRENYRISKENRAWQNIGGYQLKLGGFPRFIQTGNDYDQLIREFYIIIRSPNVSHDLIFKPEEINFTELTDANELAAVINLIEKFPDILEQWSSKLANQKSPWEREAEAA